MPDFKRLWRRIPTFVRKPLVVVIAVPILIAGIAMLFLPGPGWAAIFLACAILATEFAFAARARDAGIAAAQQIIRRLKRAWRAYTFRSKTRSKHKQ